jgi:hypothetical protein
MEQHLCLESATVKGGVDMHCLLWLGYSDWCRCFITELKHAEIKVPMAVNITTRG